MRLLRCGTSSTFGDPLLMLHVTLHIFLSVSYFEFLPSAKFNKKEEYDSLCFSRGDVSVGNNFLHSLTFQKVSKLLW